MPTLVGAGMWAVLLAWIVADYSSPPASVIWLSLVYPIYYVALSVYLDRRTPRPAREKPRAVE